MAYKENDNYNLSRHMVYGSQKYAEKLARRFEHSSNLYKDVKVVRQYKEKHALGEYFEMREKDKLN